MRSASLDSLVTSPLWMSKRHTGRSLAYRSNNRRSSAEPSAPARRMPQELGSILGASPPEACRKRRPQTRNKSGRAKAASARGPTEEAQAPAGRESVPKRQSRQCKARSLLLLEPPEASTWGSATRTALAPLGSAVLNAEVNSPARCCKATSQTKTRAGDAASAAASATPRAAMAMPPGPRSAEERPKMNNTGMAPVCSWSDEPTWTMQSAP
mmetsp:Transcript_56747/g.143797  ORF Transcript_56747/g.143797 Transcript_56747/m.143797 type:complete len:212 (+) Transcript_56747:601-1236(+)